MLHSMRCYNENFDTTADRIISSYAYAVSEENACGNTVVTAPTCGSAGVLPAVFYYMQTDRGFPESEIIDALAVSGLIGNVIRTKAARQRSAVPALWQRPAFPRCFSSACRKSSIPPKWQWNIILALPVTL